MNRRTSVCASLEQEGFSSGILCCHSHYASRPAASSSSSFWSVTTQKLHVGQIIRQAFHSRFISTTAQSFLFPLKKSTGGFFHLLSRSGFVFLSLSQSLFLLFVCIHPTFLPFIQSQTQLSQESVDLFPHTHFFIASTSHTSLRRKVSNASAAFAAIFCEEQLLLVHKELLIFTHSYVNRNSQCLTPQFSNPKMSLFFFFKAHQISFLTPLIKLNFIVATV